MGRINGSWAQVTHHVGSHHLVFGNISFPSLEVAGAPRDSRSVTMELKSGQVYWWPRDQEVESQEIERPRVSEKMARRRPHY